ncbi:MAG: endonuclease V [Infirmifilum sp.]
MIPEDFSVEKARFAQKKIAEKVKEADEIDFPIRYAAGVDIAYKGENAIAAAVVIDATTFSPVEASVVETEVRFPYIPTFLAFRETWPAFKALQALKTPFQLVFVDGNGRLHPYKAGFACHLGVIIRKPTIGIAKKLLIGNVEKINERLGKVIYNNEVLAYAVRLGRSKKYVYVSVGNMITLNTALKLTMYFTRKNASIPEPIRQAHLYATRAKG